MAFSSPTKIPRVDGEEFSQLRDKFRLVAYSALDPATPRNRVKEEVTELGVLVMRKFGGMDLEIKTLRRDLAKAKHMRNNMEIELEAAKAAQDFLRNDVLNPEQEGGSVLRNDGVNSELEEGSVGGAIPTVTEEEAEAD